MQLQAWGVRSEGRIAGAAAQGLPARGALPQAAPENRAAPKGAGEALRETSAADAGVVQRIVPRVALSATLGDLKLAAAFLQEGGVRRPECALVESADAGLAYRESCIIRAAQR